MSSGSLHRVLSSSSAASVEKTAVASAIGVHLKRSSNPYRKPSFYFPRMRDLAGADGQCSPAPSSGVGKSAEPLIFAEHLGTAHPLFAIASSSCEYYALRLPLLKAGFKRVGLSLNPSVPANLIWGRSMAFETVEVSSPGGSGKRTTVVRTPKSANPEVQEHYSALAMSVQQQRFNHYPYSHRNVGCKRGLGQNLRRVQEFLATGLPTRNKGRSFSAKNVEEKYQFVPKTWFYPAEKDALVDVFKKAPPSQHFIWKPARGSCGRGIRITKGGIQNTSSWEQVMKHIDAQSLEPQQGRRALKDYVVQEYLQDPYLLHGRKMDLRLYVCVTSYDPLIVYLHEEGLVRLAADTYTAQPSDEDGGNNWNTVSARFKHLTNYSIGRRYKHCAHALRDNEMDENSDWPAGEPLPGTANVNDNKTESATAAVSTAGGTAAAAARAATADTDVELKWSLQRLWDYVDANSSGGGGGASAKLKEDIAILITRTLMAVKPVIGTTVARVQSPGSFIELYGFDVMLDKDLRSYLVEVNTLPSLESSSPFDYATKTNVVADMLNLSCLEPFERDGQKLSLYLDDARMVKAVDPRVAPLVHTLAEQQSLLGQSTPSLPLKEELRCRLTDELQYARGFKRIFPPLSRAEALETGSPISIQNKEMRSDISLFAQKKLLSGKDLCVLNAC